jgi:hypothetical protein
LLFLGGDIQQCPRRSVNSFAVCRVFPVTPSE